jgi:hypothetical protein
MTSAEYGALALAMLSFVLLGAALAGLVLG